MNHETRSVLVTGAAGFIGSWVSQTLLELGHKVLGVDSFVDFYPRAIKEANLSELRVHSRFEFVEKNLAEAPSAELKDWLSDYPFVSHQAAQAGVRTSWGSRFEEYIRNNILATQILLEAAKDSPVKKIVYASSSSVYGDAKNFPLREEDPVSPISPYGVTKLAGEHLTRLYSVNYQVPAVALRYFTVYGPRQRPDMAFHRMIKCVLDGEIFPVYGDGSQSRSFTYVSDVAQANVSALFAENQRILGKSINIGGGSRAALSGTMDLVEELTGVRLSKDFQGVQRGDVDKTEADLTRAREWLGYSPKVAPREGLAAEIEWFRSMRSQGIL